ncbi:unnamed protein product [Amoebophrya sp. A120]|nr:unnamed protein product [Amoebophrya sp. A120]|eukprot:GSA120T00023091001.1
MRTWLLKTAYSCLVSKAKITPGEQITINYGYERKDDFQFFAQYGFLPQGRRRSIPLPRAESGEAEKHPVAAKNLGRVVVGGGSSRRSTTRAADEGNNKTKKFFSRLTRYLGNATTEVSKPVAGRGSPALVGTAGTRKNTTNITKAPAEKYPDQATKTRLQQASSSSSQQQKRTRP